MHQKVYIPFLYTIIIAFLYNTCQRKFTVFRGLFRRARDQDKNNFQHFAQTILAVLHN